MGWSGRIVLLARNGINNCVGQRRYPAAPWHPSRPTIPRSLEQAALPDSPLAR
jgi:hypothetical protein